MSGLSCLSLKSGTSFPVRVYSVKVKLVSFKRIKINAYFV